MAKENSQAPIFYVPALPDWSLSPKKLKENQGDRWDPHGPIRWSKSGFARNGVSSP